MSSRSGPEEDGDASTGHRLMPVEGLAHPHVAGPEAGAIAQCVDRPAEGYSPSR